MEESILGTSIASGERRNPNGFNPEDPKDNQAHSDDGLNDDHHCTGSGKDKISPDSNKKTIAVIPNSKAEGKKRKWTEDRSSDSEHHAVSLNIAKSKKTDDSPNSTIKRFESNTLDANHSDGGVQENGEIVRDEKHSPSCVPKKDLFLNNHGEKDGGNDNLEELFSYHRSFVKAIFEIGLRNSSPSVIQEEMIHPNKDVLLTSERLKSHLQKIRRRSSRSSSRPHPANNKDKINKKNGSNMKHATNTASSSSVSSCDEFLQEYDATVKGLSQLRCINLEAILTELSASLGEENNHLRYPAWRTAIGAEAVAFLTMVICQQDDDIEVDGDHVEEALTKDVEGVGASSDRGSCNKARIDGVNDDCDKDEKEFLDAASTGTRIENLQRRGSCFVSAGIPRPTLSIAEQASPLGTSLVMLYGVMENLAKYLVEQRIQKIAKLLIKGDQLSVPSSSSNVPTTSSSPGSRALAMTTKAPSNMSLPTAPSRSQRLATKQKDEPAAQKPGPGTRNASLHHGSNTSRIQHPRVLDTCRQQVGTMDQTSLSRPLGNSSNTLIDDSRSNAPVVFDLQRHKFSTVNVHGPRHPVTGGPTTDGGMSPHASHYRLPFRQTVQTSGEERRFHIAAVNGGGRVAGGTFHTSGPNVAKAAAEVVEMPNSVDTQRETLGTYPPWRVPDKQQRDMSLGQRRQNHAAPSLATGTVEGAPTPAYFPSPFLLDAPNQNPASLGIWRNPSSIHMESCNYRNHDGVGGDGSSGNQNETRNVAGTIDSHTVSENYAVMEASAAADTFEENFVDQNLRTIDHESLLLHDPMMTATTTVREPASSLLSSSPWMQGQQLQNYGWTTSTTTRMSAEEAMFTLPGGNITTTALSLDGSNGTWPEDDDQEAVR